MCDRPVGLIADLNGDGRGELLATCTHTNKLAVTPFRSGEPEGRAMTGRYS